MGYLDVENLENLQKRGRKARSLLWNAPFPPDLEDAIAGRGNGTDVIQTGQAATICCSEGDECHVYDGAKREIAGLTKGYAEKAKLFL